MSIILDVIEKINTKWNKKGYVVKRTYYERPRFLLVGFVWVFGYMGLMFVLMAFTNVLDVASAPFDFLIPAIKPFFEPEITLIGWILTVVILIGTIIIMTIPAIPGAILMSNYQNLTDKEWPNDPDKTQEWRTKYATDKNKTT